MCARSIRWIQSTNTPTRTVDDEGPDPEHEAVDLHAVHPEPERSLLSGVERVGMERVGAGMEWNTRPNAFLAKGRRLPWPAEGPGLFALDGLWDGKGGL